MAPHQQFFEIFEKVEYLHDHEELDIGNGTVFFSERSSFRKADNFLNKIYLTLWIFSRTWNKFLKKNFFFKYLVVFLLVQFLLSQIQSTPYVEPASISLTADLNVRDENNITTLLLLATRQDLKKLQQMPRTPVIGTSKMASLNNGKFKSNILLRNLHNVFAINFHYKKKIIFFPDNLEQTIMSVPFDDFDTKNNKVSVFLKFFY